MKLENELVILIEGIDPGVITVAKKILKPLKPTYQDTEGEPDNLLVATIPKSAFSNAVDAFTKEFNSDNVKRKSGSVTIKDKVNKVLIQIFQDDGEVEVLVQRLGRG